MPSVAGRQAPHSRARWSGPGLGAGHDFVTASPGSHRGLHLVVADIAAARDELASRGVEVEEIRSMADG